jgi:hypothetical protein
MRNPSICTHPVRPQSSTRWSLGGLTLLLAALVLAGGCSHDMEVTNLDEYKTSPVEGQKFGLAIVPFKGDGDQQVYYKAVVAGLRRHPQIGQLATDWTPERKDVRFTPRRIIKLDIQPAYSGSGQNFLTTFPGFIVFACAWHGYDYNADIKTEVTLLGPDGEPIPVAEGQKDPNCRVVATNFKMRHCDFERGFWSGTGWWFPGWGIHNIITGAVFTNYDPDATEPFHQVADSTYGGYVAEHIVHMCGGPASIKPAQNVASR